MKQKRKKTIIMVHDEEGFILPNLNPTLEVKLDSGEKMAFKPENPNYNIDNFPP